MKTLQSVLIFFGPLLAMVFLSFPFVPIILRKAGIETIGFWFFMPLLMPQFIDDFTRVQLSSFVTGDSKSSMLAISSVVAPCVLLELLASKSKLLKRNRIRLKASQIIFMMTLFGLSLLSIYGGLSNLRPFVPTFGALGFFYLVTFLIRFEIDLKKFLKGFFRFGFVVSVVTVTLAILKFPWLSRTSNYLDVDFAAYLTSTYISPFNKFLDIPLREGFYFNEGTQAAAIFFGTLFVVMLSGKDVKHRYFFLALPFLAGSLTGSRTFYLMCMVGLVFNFARVSNRSSLFFSPVIRMINLILLYNLGGFLASFFVSNSNNLQSFSGRTQIWQLVISRWDENGLMGHGMGTLKSYVSNLHWAFSFEHAHNSILQWLWDFGLLGFTLALICHLVVLLYWVPKAADFSDFNSSYSIVTLPILVAFTEITLTMSANSIFGLGWLVILLMILNSTAIVSTSADSGTNLNQ